MKCPTCKSSKGLSVTCQATHRVYIDREGNVMDSDQVDGFEWDSTNGARCTVCEWNGTVKDLNRRGNR